METHLMARLARRVKLANRLGIEFVDDSWPYLKVKTWAGVARVVGEAKQTFGDRPVYVRGQTDNHGVMTPSLFRRGRNNSEVLLAAEDELVRKLREKIPVARFRRADLGGLLQHYGFRTRWLDVVDNLFVAYWFAAHEISAGTDGAIQVCTSGRDTGWLFLIGPPPGEALVSDLRLNHHPLSTRPHVQHGLSLAAQCENTANLRDWVLATIRTTVRGSVVGDLFTGPALFPPKSEDHTLRLLLKHRADRLAEKIEEEYQLSCRTLGRVSYWPDPA